MIIDTHHHLWKYNPVEFDWLDSEMAEVRRSFFPEDLKTTLANTGVECVVTVQARQVLEETEWLLKLASENSFMKGIVGWVPLASENIQQILEGYKNNSWLKGVRHVVQGEADPQFILGENFNRGGALLKNYNLVYDILIFEHQLPNTIRFVDIHPEQVFVLDHIGKPKIKSNEFQPWEKNIKELAKCENVSCKISGMVTEASCKNWTEEQLRPYFDVVLEAFGPSRLMFGSDWPVCLVATSYSYWLEVVKKKISTFSTNEQEMILFKNAIKTYNIKFR